MPGFYKVTGIGTGNGPYSISIQTTGDHNVLVPETIVATGVAALGQALVPVERLGLVLRTQAVTGHFDDALADLRSMVDRSIKRGGISSAGIATSLIQKIQNAGKKIAQGDLRAATGLLGAFVNEVRAQRGKQIGISDADDLLTYVLFLRDFLITAAGP